MIFLSDSYSADEMEKHLVYVSRTPNCYYDERLHFRFEVDGNLFHDDGQLSVKIRSLTVVDVIKLMFRKQSKIPFRRLSLEIFAHKPTTNVLAVDLRPFPLRRSWRVHPGACPISTHKAGGHFCLLRLEFFRPGLKTPTLCRWRPSIIGDLSEP